MAFDFIGSLPRVAHARALTRGPRTCMHPKSLSLFPYVRDVRFHEGRMLRNQTLASNGFRIVHIDCAVISSYRRQQISEKQRGALPRRVYLSEFRNCFGGCLKFLTPESYNFKKKQTVFLGDNILIL